MKAFVLTRFGSAEKAFELQNLPDPEPRENEIVIEAEAFGLNYADVMARKGMYRDAPKKPCVIGYETVGRIIKVGKAVQHLKTGQRVAAFSRFGAYATQVVTQSAAATLIPDDMEVGIALALTVQYCTAWFAAEEMVRLHEGDHVLIQAAAGGVGTALVQLARRKKCVIYGTAGSDKKIEYLKTHGVDHAINYNSQDFSEVIRGLRGKKGLDVVFDSLGGRTFRKGKKLLAPGGRIVGYGAAERSGGMNLGIITSLQTLFGFGFPSPAFLLMNSIGIIGVNMLRIADHKPEVLQRCLLNVAELAAKGELKPMIGGVFPAAELAKAHTFLESRASMGKIAVIW